MPQFMDETLARALYKRTHDGIVLAYGRDFWTLGAETERLALSFTNKASGMVNLGVVTNASILVVGSAFGYLMESLIGLGVTDVWGIDSGPWFWDPANDADWAPGTKARTANDWIGSGTERTSLNAIGVTGQAKFTFIVDEDAAPGHSDAELPVFIAGLEARLQGNVKGRIIHIVTPVSETRGPGDSSQNWKTLTDWQAVAPDHTWVDARTL